jgi:hypothetical protein
MSDGPNAGWGYLRNSPKWHYFDKLTAMSACGKWMRLGSMNDLDDSNDGSVDNCKACQRKVKTMRARAAARTVAE